MIAVEDVAYVRLAAPDLDQMESCLIDFGLQRAVRTENHLFMRGYGPDPVIHITEKGELRHIGLAFKAQSGDDLARLAAEHGKCVESRKEPGGGLVVKLVDPDGNQVEIVHGLQMAPAAPLREPIRFNPAHSRVRRNEAIRLEPLPSHVMRLGHVVLHVRDLPSAHAFYGGVLGLRLSDSYYAGEPGNIMAAFLHCGLGDRFTDHHSIALIADNRSGFDHLGFEVLDMDDLMMGNRHLQRTARWEHSWGVGRHIDGSQIFDYWRDPFGLKIEHWTDGDLVNDTYKAGSTAFSPEGAADALAQWAPPFSLDFMR
ncbi:MAG: VOC family protein [Pseudomonadota bacterium]|nr:VOC family protein [Pseudomonadota bacterium]